MATWQDVKDAVARETDAEKATVMTLDSVRKDLEEALKRETLDPVELQGVVDSLKASTDDMAARVVKNTPADPEPMPEASPA